MSEDYCELCDLPRSQCVHGMPPAPAPAPKPATRTPRPRTRTTTAPQRAAAPARRVAPRFTSPDGFRPLIVATLEEAGGTLPNERLFEALEEQAEDRLLPGDRETTPQGELRWRYAVRRARVAMIDEGVLVKTHPDTWQLTTPATTG